MAETANKILPKAPQSVRRPAANVAETSDVKFAKTVSFLRKVFPSDKSNTPEHPQRAEG